jgi:hypothetical protein
MGDLHLGPAGRRALFRLAVAGSVAGLAAMATSGGDSNAATKARSAGATTPRYCMTCYYLFNRRVDHARDAAPLTHGQPGG